MTGERRGRERPTADLPSWLERKRPAEVLDLIDAALEDHAASLLPQAPRSAWSESVRPRD